MAKSTRNLAIIGILALALGGAGWIIQLSGGLLAGSGMTNIFLWGLTIGLFAFMVGFGAGSQIVASIIYLSGKEHLRPIANVAAVCGLACVAAAGVAIIADLGAARNILAMIFGLNLRSPLAWDMISMTAFIVLSVIQLIAIARDMSSVKVWVTLTGVAAVVLQIIEGLLFSTQSAHNWWASPLMPIDFLAVAVVSGGVLTLLIACIKKESSNIISWLGRLCAIAIAVHLVLAIADLCIVAMEGTPESEGVLSVIVAYLPLYICELLLPAIAMVILFTAGRSGEVRTGICASVITIIGIFCHRLMLLYPAYNAPSLYLTLSGTDATTGPYPISTGRYLDWDQTFALSTPYIPSGIEWLAGLLPIGVAIIAALIILWIMKKLQRA